jgi:hypothetical protein
MGAEELGNSAFWFGVITAIGAIVGLFIALFTYRQASKQSQQNFIEAQLTRNREQLKDVIVPLIETYDAAHVMNIATDILDDGSYELPKKDPSYYRYKNGLVDKKALEITLRDHEKDQTSPGEDEIRNSFDELLGFFARLEYTMGLDLVKRDQLNLFNYFIEKAADNPGVVQFVRIYKAPLYGKLDPRLNCNSYSSDHANISMSR